MKKLLIGTTALVAAGIIAAPAMAAEPITLKLGGKMSQWAGSVSNQDTYEAAAGAVSARAFDVKGDSEVYFSGSTKLDNGLSVYVKMELEADRANNASSIDNSFMKISTPSMGSIILGSVAGSGKAPDAGYGTDDRDASDWYTTPTSAAATLQHQGEATSTEDSSRIDYTSPSFGGLKVGAGFVPEIIGDTTTQPLGNSSGASSSEAVAYYYKANYDAKFGGVGLSLAAQYVDIDLNSPSSSTANASASWYEWRGQGAVMFAGFTLGGEFRDYHQENGADPAVGDVYKIGIGYETGPYNFTLTRYHSSFQGSTAIAGDDEITNHSLAVAYNMGGGITAKANYTDFELEEENKAAINKNSGHILAVGISAAF
ncbi:MAG: porin [Alphaproteobacteria bacterium]|nr:porin [Alphaproteobacteria bacterium]